MLDPSKNRIWYATCLLQVYAANHSEQANRHQGSRRDMGKNFLNANPISYQKQKYTIQQRFNPDTGMRLAPEIGPIESV